MNPLRVLLFVLVVIVCVQIVYSLQNKASQAASSATEAPTGFDNQSNGHVDQATFEAARATFNEQEEISEGLGPLYNAQSCGACHRNPVSGGSSQITELRAGHYDGISFYDHPGGSLINDRATDALIQELVMSGNEVRTLRLSSSTLGLGFVEAIADSTLIDIANSQPGSTGGRINGVAIRVPVAETPNSRRIGRFGWKDQHGSLVSFAADAYLNEMGITSPLQPTENNSNGESIADYDTVADPEDDGDDVESFADFMRATKAPPRDIQLAGTPDALVGAQLFQQTGCNICHVTTIVTARAGTVINGGKFRISDALGDKIIHPYGDFLLHDIGTGDGIVQNGGQSTRNKVRTAPLWGLRTRTRLMHDGVSVSFHDAILRHAGEATFVIDNYRALNSSQKNQVLTFLRSL
jgi:CxxC motif-containing protein (DUF1111 family)